MCIDIIYLYVYGSDTSDIVVQDGGIMGSHSGKALYELTYPGCEGSVIIYMMPGRVKDARGPHSTALGAQRRIIEWFKKAYQDKYGTRLGYIEWKKLEIMRMSSRDKANAAILGDD